MRLYFVFLVIFVIAGLLIGNRILAAVEAVIVIALMIYSLISGKRRQQELLRYIESVTLNLDTQTKDTLRAASIYRVGDFKPGYPDKGYPSEYASAHGDIKYPGRQGYMEQ